MSLTVERLGNGAALLLRDEASGTALLLSCGDARDSRGAAVAPDGSAASRSERAADDGGRSDDSADGDDAAVAAIRSPVARRLARELRGLAALAAVLVPDGRPQACGMLPFLTERSGVQAPLVLMTHATRAIGPRLLADYW